MKRFLSYLLGMRKIGLWLSLLSLLVVGSQSGCFQYERRFLGGGRVEGDAYYMLEESRWAFWWLTIICPRIFTSMTWYTEVTRRDDLECRDLVDWRLWWGAQTGSMSTEELLMRWRLKWPLRKDKRLAGDRYIRLLCGDSENCELLIQQERALAPRYRVGSLGLYVRTGSEFVRVPLEESNCSLWVVFSDLTRVGPYLIPYVMDLEAAYIDRSLQSRYRTDALFCFDLKSQALYTLYQEAEKCYLERWLPNEKEPRRDILSLPMAESMPFYFWLLEESIGVASWNSKTGQVAFTTFDRESLRECSSVSVSAFPKPPSIDQVPNYVRKQGDWLYVINPSGLRAYSRVLLFVLGDASERSVTKREPRECVLRFNLINGKRECYYAK